MYSLQLRCSPEEVEAASAELWDYGTVAISETDGGPWVRLLAGFESDGRRDELLQRFSRWQPEWEQDDTDWEMQSREAWPPREVGTRIFLAPPWCRDETPAERVRLMHNPGTASGTGEHPCTQLALQALERYVNCTSRVVDVGSGSGILAIAAVLLGASTSIAVDTDEASLPTARENFGLNGLRPLLLCGSADSIVDGFADIVVANISGSVLLSLMDELLRITATTATLVLTGFTEGEASTFQRMFPQAEESACHEWGCLIIPLSLSV